jgi:HEAT repeat protein
MATSFRLIASSLAASVTLAAAVAAQQPRISNGRVTSQAAGSSFAQTFKSLLSAQSEVAWIGYTVPAADGQRLICCNGNGGDGVWISNGGVMTGGACRLDNGAGTTASDRSSTPSRPDAATPPVVKLEGSDRLVVLYRIAERRVDRIRVFSEDCQLDAGGRAVHWLESVAPADSIALLESLTGPDRAGSSRTMEGAVMAIALHGDTAADTALERLVAPAQPEDLRKKITFWLGNARGRRGFDALRRVLRDDPSIEVRKGAVFGLSQSRVPESFDALAALARTDNEPRIRSEALFWLAHKSDSRAAKIITDALEKDASPEVRKKAVFALTQLKDDSGIAPLIQVARTHSDPATRGEAIFWLGQKAGRVASAAITERLAQDPDTEVKKKAVFALSQLPAAEGVPLLIKVARTNTNPEVRKQAMFWLGQSKDSRALDFFAEVLR